MLYVTFTSFKTSFLSSAIWYFSWFNRFSNCWNNCGPKKQKCSFIDIICFSCGLFNIDSFTLSVRLRGATNLNCFLPEVESQRTDKGAPSADTSSYFDVAVGVSVVMALVLIFNVVVVVWLWIRQWTLPCAGKVYCTYLCTVLSYLRMPHCIILTQLTY